MYDIGGVWVSLTVGPATVKGSGDAVKDRMAACPRRLRRRKYQRMTDMRRNTTAPTLPPIVAAVLLGRDECKTPSEFLGAGTLVVVT